MRLLRHRLCCAVLTAMLIALGSPAAALAHAELVESDPADGATITVPYTLRAEYSDDLGGNSRIVVHDASGSEVARGGISGDDPRVMTAELETLAPGSYVALWRAVTPDDNGVTRGSIAFTVATSPPTQAMPSPTTAAQPSPSPASPAGSAPPATGSTSPAPSDGSPTTATTDLLIALLVAGALLGALALFLWRRRAA